MWCSTTSALAWPRRHSASGFSIGPVCIFLSVLIKGHPFLTTGFRRRSGFRIGYAFRLCFNGVGSAGVSRWETIANERVMPYFGEYLRDMVMEIMMFKSMLLSNLSSPNLEGRQRSKSNNFSKTSSSTAQSPGAPWTKNNLPFPSPPPSLQRL